MTRGPSSWSQVLSLFGTPTRPRRGWDGEQLWSSPSDSDYLDLRLPRKTSFLLVCPKAQPVGWWQAQGSLPPDVAAMCAPLPADRRALPLLEVLCRQASAAIFVGDMDPYSIVQYVETRRMLAGVGARLLHGGVNDAWLDAMERALSQEGRLERLRIPLEKHEVRLLKKLDRAVDLEKLIGARGSAMLHSGYKIEIEGATNPTIYRRSHSRWVFKYLRSRTKEE
jgi:hypothetical protein